MEQRIFELVRLAKQNEAYEIITGSEYARQKALYSEGLASFVELHELETIQLQSQLHKAVKRSIWLFALVILLLAITWFPIERFFRKSRKQMHNYNQELELQVQARKKSENALLKSQKQIKKAHEQLQESVKAGNVGLCDRNLQTNEACHSPEWKKQIGYRMMNCKVE